MASAPVPGEVRLVRDVHAMVVGGDKRHAVMQGRQALRLCGARVCWQCTQTPYTMLHGGSRLQVQVSRRRVYESVASAGIGRKVTFRCSR